jgi:hypothetical protein
MSKKIILEFERGGRVTATMLEEKAPQSCEIIWASLPVEGRLRHAMWAGEEVFFDEFPISRDMPLENATNSVQPGSITTGASTWVRDGQPCFKKGETAFAIFYGKGRPRKTVDETLDMNYFAHVDNVESMAAVGRRIRMQGSEKIAISRG